MKRVVITGANGMLGASLVRELLANGIEVLALVRKGERNRQNLPSHPLLKTVECGLADFAGFDGLPGDKSYDIMYHFAWAGAFGPGRDDAFLQESNIRHTLDAISLAKRLGCARFVGAGSQAEYGSPPEGQPLAPDTPTHPLTGYGMAKLSAGLLGRLHARNLGLSFVWTRILSVYGPMEKPHSLTMGTIIRLLGGEETHFTKGEQEWDFLFCEDAARAFRLMGEKGRDGATYVLGSGRTISLAQALTTLCHEVNPGSRTGLGDLPYPDGQTMYLRADIESLTNHTGFVPQVTYLEGIRKTIAWVKENL